MRRWALGLALLVAAGPAAAFDLLECDRDEVFGDSGANLGWSGTGGPLMGNWELDTSGAPGSTISAPTVQQALADAILEWTNVTGTAYTPPTTSAGTFTAADVDATRAFTSAGFGRHIVMMVHDNLVRDGLEGWAAVKSSFTTDSILGVCFTRIDLQTRLVYDADIFLNDDFSHGGPALFQGLEGTIRIGPSGTTSYEVQSIMAHEFGHAQGAAHTLRNSVMFAGIPPLTINRLTEDDGNILRWLYPVSTSPVPPDRNNLGFLTCDRLIATSEVVIEHEGGGGCHLAPRRRETWPLALVLFLVTLAAEARARRRRRG